MVFRRRLPKESDGHGATIHVEDTRDDSQAEAELGRTHRQVAASIGANAGAVAGAVSRAGEAGPDWSLAARSVALPDCGCIDAERSKEGVTLE
jgi:hypothetical protein